MRLKRLEIRGFKSFARPVCLDFGPGITAIVGPNGSGKSNISDALRWVMGEQSARSLRGYRMEDVIFAGSDGKKPLGMAEVQLTLDNSQGFFPLDYAEVTVTRRVYRSGDSEFFINRQSCRLKDIHDLFTDTGLGREGYAVIGQGQIDAVLSVRSEDRRILLEETAGIMKYRQRKEQALRKLEETSIDLLRVTDILHELESQLGPLADQAKQARLYLDLAQRLKAAELDYYHLLWQALAQKWDKSKGDQENLQREYDQCNEQLTTLEEQKAHLEVETENLEKEIDRGQQELMTLVESYNQGIHAIQLHQERLKNQATRGEQLTGIIRDKEQELELLRDEDAKLQDEFQELTARIRRQEETIVQAQRAVEDVQERQRQAQAKINSLKDDFFDFMRELAERRNFQRSFAERQSNLKAQITINQGELQVLAQRIAENEGGIAELDHQQTKLAQSFQAQVAAEQEIQTELDETKAALAKNENSKRLLEGQLAQVTTRFNTLQELQAGYEGYALGVRRVMQNLELSTLVLGTVADVVTVPPGLEVAFEVALGSSLQNLITSGEKDAKTIIAWLQKVQGGRVTILPLDSVRGSEFSAEAKTLLQQPGILGTALDLLTFSEKYRPALASLLGRVIITEELDTALALKRRLAQFSRIVTRDGSVVFPSGAMTGGSLNNRTSGLLSRKGELNDLEKRTLALQEQLGDQRVQENDLSRVITKIEQRLALLQANNVETKLEAQSIRQAREQALRQRENLVQTQEELKEKTEELRAMLGSLGSECEQAATQVSDLELEEMIRREQIQNQEASLGNLATIMEQVSLNQTREHVQLAELKGFLETQRIQLANLEQRKKNALSVRSQTRNELAALADAQLQNEQTISETTAANEARLLQKNELQRDVEQQKRKRQEVLKENARLGAELVQIQKELLRCERALYKWEVELTQLEKDKEQILSTLAERELALASILSREVNVKEATLKRTVSELRGQIRDLGLVNPGAPEEYERVLERCSFLQTQLKDLDEARESLQAVITEMDKLCRTKLREVFKQVQSEFQKIFSQLFLGGKAELILTDPESILTTGIDVMARPPGKKLQNLLVLSGGERALTAIALLFAIRRVKPTPFWVLDEIDAALDESNLGRFVELMEEFSKETQFLVVTHRPRTMEAAHTLYGVTMGEEAFSQIISVALS